MDKQLSLQQKEKTELSVRKEQKKKFVHEETILLHPGHKLWEINTVDRTICLAKYEAGPVKLDVSERGEPIIPRGKLIIRKNCVYIAALNKKNAIKKFTQFRNGSRLDPRDVYLKLPILKL